MRTIRELAALLPAGDAELEAVLREAVRTEDADALRSLLLAALDAGRPVDAAILAEGLGLLNSLALTAKLATRVRGDARAALLAGCRGPRLPTWQRGSALLLMARIGRPDGAGWPEGLLVEARKLARHVVSAPLRSLLVALADITEDPGLADTVAPFRDDRIERGARELLDEVDEQLGAEPLAGFPEEPSPEPLSGFTVRRAVARVGRNEPCPCGSGKKYKRCCLERDRERLLDSSEVPGVTRQELSRDPALGLTSDRLKRMDRHELLRLEPAAIPEELGEDYLQALWSARAYQAVARFLETRGHWQAIDEYVCDAIECAVRDGDVETGRRLLALRGDLPFDFPLTLLARLKLELEAGPILETLEREVARDLDGAGPVELAWALLSQSPALGIVAARGALATAGLLDAELLLIALLETRDELGLTPHDPIEASVAERLGGADEEPDEVAVLRNALEAKTAELRALTRRVARHSARLDHERQARPEPASTGAREPVPAAPASPVVDQELRAELASLKSALKERHLERNQLRRQLEDLRRDLIAREKSGETVAAARSAEPEDEGEVAASGDFEPHPPRLPVLSKELEEALAELPKDVARLALRRIGGLSAGDASAFHDARRLQIDRTLWRARIGLSHRLLFRTEPQRLVLLAIVARQDFERAVKRHARP